MQGPEVGKALWLTRQHCKCRAGSAHTLTEIGEGKTPGWVLLCTRMNSRQRVHTV